MASRRTQPYRKRIGRPIGPAANAMKKGRTGSGHNPMDVKRAVTKRANRGKRKGRRLRLY